MNFNSLAFLIFLPVVLLLWRALPRKFRWAELLFASYLFYAWFDALLLIPILAITAASYLSARGMAGARSAAAKRALLAVTLIACLGTLFVFKYLDFVVGLGFSIARLCGGNGEFAGFDIVLPMGISFYTFQTLSYVIDVYRGTVPPEKHYGYYSLFVVFFPQLVAGPIERPQNLIPQLRDASDPCADDISRGVRKLVIGFAKKIMIADFVGRFVDAAFSQTGSGGGAYAIATALFAVQIYCDFSGYTDIAIGSARLMGIRLSENFDKPYGAASIREFWRRWHISLSSWLSDYLYKPLGGSRKGLARQCLNIFVVFLCSGLWHGASLNFVVWGLLHGGYMIVNILFGAVKNRSERLEKACATKPYIIFAHALTLFAVWFAWIFFRAQSLAEAANAVSAIFTAAPAQCGSTLAALGMKASDIPMTAAAILLLLSVERLPVIDVNALPARVASYAGGAVAYFATVCAIAVMWLYALQSGGVGGFIYFRF